MKIPIDGMETGTITRIPTPQTIKIPAAQPSTIIFTTTVTARRDTGCLSTITIRRTTCGRQASGLTRGTMISLPIHGILGTGPDYGIQRSHIRIRIGIHVRDTIRTTVPRMVTVTGMETIIRCMGEELSNPVGEERRAARAAMIAAFELAAA
jgi:hypothetical protein